MTRLRFRPDPFKREGYLSRYAWTKLPRPFGTMTEKNVNLGPLYSGAGAADFEKDRRYKTGARLTLDLLGLPYPPYLTKGEPGPNPNRAMRELYAREHQQRLPR